MTEHLRELRYATRRLHATPAFAVASTLVLALALGMGTALFSVINATVLRPQPFEERPCLVKAAWTTDGRELAGYTGFPSAIAHRLLFERNFTTMTLAGFQSEESGHDLALQNPGALEDAVAVSRTDRRSSGLLLVSIGLLAMTIALVGIYGLVSHSITERLREFGVLIALGASGSALLVRLMTEFGRPLIRGALFGVAASLPGAFLSDVTSGTSNRSTGWPSASSRLHWSSSASAPRCCP